MAELDGLREEIGAPNSAARLPPWTQDELILALDLYMTNPSSPPGKGSIEVAELSEVLNRLAVRLGTFREAEFRNANGVYMKMMNFRRFDPRFAEAGKVGLRRGNKLEAVVWNTFAGDRDKLRAVASAIKNVVAASEWDDAKTGFKGEPDEDPDFVEAEEGRLLTRLHRVRERNRALVMERKRRELARSGRLSCEACEFDFESRYGPRGAGFIEAHHTKPVHTLAEGDVTRLEDLALVCANCHRMIHASRPWLSIEELRGLLGGR